MSGTGILRAPVIGLVLISLAAIACNALPFASNPTAPAPSTDASQPPATRPHEIATPTPGPFATPENSEIPTEIPTETPTSARASASPETVAYTNPDGPPSDGEDAAFFEHVQKLATFAGVWRDENGHDLHIAVTKDIDGAIAAVGQYVPAGLTVYFQLAPHSQKEVCGLRDRIINDRVSLLQLGIVVNGGGCGNEQMTAVMEMSPVTPETVAYMNEHYSGPLTFEDTGVVPLVRYDPPTGDETLRAITPSDAAALLTCGQRPFPASALTSAPIDVTTAGPEFTTLRSAFATYQPLFGDLSAQPWILAEKDQFGATFLTTRGGSYLEEMVVAGEAGWVPTTLSDCEPVKFAIAEPGPPASDAWSLDPQYPKPDSSATELHVLVREANCSGGTSAAGRVEPPIVDYSDASLTMTVAVRPLGGIVGCPGNPALPVTIVLPQPLGDRTLEGGTDPSQLQ